MRYVSVFSGVEAATLAWDQLGWEPVAFSEIDPFPSAVLAERFPNVPNLGDITQIDWSQIGTVDLVVGGSPCQSFSVAGKREGLAGASGLMFEYIRCVRELRPRWFVWENVPGALSSEGGAAFGQLLTEMDDLGYGLAWRILDAQFFGVAQRRRRVFLVGSLGDGGSERACEVLFEPESLRGNPPSSREKRKALATRAEDGPGGAGGCLTPWDNQSKRIFSPDSCGPTLNSGTHEGQNIQPSVFCAGFKYHQGAGAGNIGYIPEQPPTLTADWHNPAVFCMADDNAETAIDADCIEQRPAMTTYAIRMRSGKPGGGKGALVQTEVSGTLATSNDQTIIETDDSVAFTQNTRDEVRYVNGDGANPGVKQTSYVKEASVVRRLTPRECERLQGMPDDWTRIPYRGKPAEDCPDGPRYKAIGNSMAVPVMRWIGQRIAMVDKLEVPKQLDPRDIVARLARKILTEAEEDARAFALKAGRKPLLRVLTFNCDEASKVYVRNKLRDCERVGIDCDVVEFKATDNTSDVRYAIWEANDDCGVDGVILQLPVPKHIDPRVVNALDPGKDVDGVTCENACRLRAGDPWLEPCTPAGVMRLLHKIGAVKPGLKAVVIGRSEIVGKPMADMLQLADMTVTVCNSKTPHPTLADECRRADVIVTAVGKPGLITPEMLGYDQVVIDVGITRGDDGKLHGDVDPACADCCAFLSPVPGGVGLLTRAMLAHNVVKAARGY